MDHLPPVEKPSYHPPEVPYLCCDGFEDTLGSKGFDAYPAHKGFDPKKLDYSHYPVNELNSFLQEWLYFGLLGELLSTFKIKFAKKDFIQKNNEGVLVITSKKLLHYLDLWGTAFAQGMKRKQRDQCERAWSLCQVATYAVQRLGESAFLSTVDIAVKCLSKEQALHLSLAIVIEGIQDELDRANLSILPRNGDKSLGLPYLVDILRANNRCVYHLQGFFGRPKELFFLSLLPALEYAGHSQCSLEQCKGGEVNEEIYETQHISGCQSCEFVGPDSDQLLEFYISCSEEAQRLRIPIVRVIYTGESIKLGLENASGNYTAISHVWSDGLGNPDKNSLPSCQLKRLARLCVKVQGRDGFHFQIEGWPRLSWLVYFMKRLLLPLFICFHFVLSFIWSRTLAVRGYLMPWRWEFPAQVDASPVDGFWIDTLCVPVANRNEISSADFEAPASQGEASREFMRRLEARNLAIAQMQNIYSSAHRVLVLDEDIQNVGSSRHERLYRVLLSRWMTRLWTLQEGICNFPRVFFQLDDAVLSIWELFCMVVIRFIEEGAAHVGLISQIYLWMNSGFGYGWMVRLRSRFGRSIAEAYQANPGLWLSNALFLLSSRSTSKAADEAICIATACGRPEIVPELLALPAEVRMGSLIYEIGPHFGVGIMFTPGTRMSFPGLRWCPETFLSQSSLSDVPPLLRLGETAQTMNLSAGPISLTWLVASLSAPKIKSLNSIDTMQSLPRARLTENGLCCKLPAWKWSTTAVKGRQRTRIATADFGVGSPQKFFTLRDRISKYHSRDLSLDSFRGDLAMLFSVRLEELGSPIGGVLHGVLVRFAEGSQDSLEYTPVAYICPVEAQRENLNNEEQVEAEDLARKGEISVFSVLNNGTGWLVD